VGGRERDKWWLEAEEELFADSQNDRPVVSILFTTIWNDVESCYRHPASELMYMPLASDQFTRAAVTWAGLLPALASSACMHGLSLFLLC
jgi:hypothetical protein